ncbi:unnamed protein product, partial [Iphiclides podalirius]
MAHPEGMLDFLMEKYPELYRKVVEEVTNSSRPFSRASSQGATTSSSSSQEEMELDSPLSPDADEGGLFTQVVNKKKCKRKKRSSQPSSAAPSPVPPVKAPRPTESAIAGPSRPTPPTPSPSAKQTPVASQPTPAPPAAPRAPQDKRPPPLFIRDTEKWPMEAISALSNRLKFVATTTAQGIKLQLETADAHRQVSKFLGAKQVFYHTYTLAEDRILRAFIKRIPSNIPTETVLDSLKEQNLPVHAVHRTKSRRKRTPIDMVMVHLDLSPEEEAIFNIESVIGLTNIVIEPPHKATLPGQCHKCQNYGHAARNCFAKPRCVKCLGDHGTPDCPRPRDKALLANYGPPACVLCQQHEGSQFQRPPHSLLFAPRGRTPWPPLGPNRIRHSRNPNQPPNRRLSHHHQKRPGATPWTR